MLAYRHNTTLAKCLYTAFLSFVGVLVGEFLTNHQAFIVELKPLRLSSSMIAEQYVELKTIRKEQ